MAAGAATVTNVSLDWAEALRSKVVPPRGVHYKYPLIASDMKERELVVIHLQRQRILFGSVEKAAENAEEGKLVLLSDPAVCLLPSTVKFQDGLPRHTAARVGQVQGGQILQVPLQTGAV